MDVGACQFRHNLTKTLDRRAIWNVRQAQELAGEGDVTRAIVRLHRASRGLDGFTHRLDALACRKRVSRAVAKPLGDVATGRWVLLLSTVLPSDCVGWSRHIYLTTFVPPSRFRRGHRH